MSSNDDLLASLQSSMRNALFTFGASSQQYQNIKAMVDEHIASKHPSTPLASTAQPGPVFTLAHRPKPRPT
ncbi:hypothetical protein AOQ84DRAFT_375814 [Glonium stellatum]|uniref:Uncharacterized protein n=1 Tax=Glonium stellatum TaxID=574774 RepID=A0A8E2JTV9_9PEZI|nr:hypothetical protein AOQ84DRAFT_375814 [Glonium stellatum]